MRKNSTFPDNAIFIFYKQELKYMTELLIRINKYCNLCVRKFLPDEG